MAAGLRGVLLLPISQPAARGELSSPAHLKGTGKDRGESNPYELLIPLGGRDANNREVLTGEVLVVPPPTHPPLPRNFKNSKRIEGPSGQKAYSKQM